MNKLVGFWGSEDDFSIYRLGVIEYVLNCSVAAVIESKVEIVEEDKSLNSVIIICVTVFVVVLVWSILLLIYFLNKKKKTTPTIDLLQESPERKDNQTKTPIDDETP